MQCLAFIPGRDGGGREGGEVSWGLNRNHTHTHTHLNGTIVASKPRRRTFSSVVEAVYTVVSASIDSYVRENSPPC